jgi:hypothetical protein
MRVESQSVTRRLSAVEWKDDTVIWKEIVMIWCKALATAWRAWDTAMIWPRSELSISRLQISSNFDFFYLVRTVNKGFLDLLSDSGKVIPGESHGTAMSHYVDSKSDRIDSCQLLNSYCEAERKSHINCVVGYFTELSLSLLHSTVHLRKPCNIIGDVFFLTWNITNEEFLMALRKALAALCIL